MPIALVGPNGGLVGPGGGLVGPYVPPYLPVPQVPHVWTVAIAVRLYRVGGSRRYAVAIAVRLYRVGGSRRYVVAIATRLYRTHAMALVNVEKDPGATLDYQFDWSAAGENISSSVWVADTGLTVSSESETSSTATVRLTGGTLGQQYKVKNTVTFASGQIDVRRLLVVLQEQ